MNVWYEEKGVCARVCSTKDNVFVCVCVVVG